MNKNGGIRIGVLVWILLISAVVYGGIKFIPPYFTYYMMKTEIENDAATAHLYSDQQIADYILNRARELELTIEENSLVVERRDYEIEVSLKYKVDVNFFDRYIKTLYFNIDTVKPLKAKQ